MTPPLLFVGIEVAKPACVVAVRPTGTTWTVPQTEAGWAALATRLQGLAPTLVLCEATGGLELPLASGLAAAGLPLAIVNPQQVRDFAKAKGLLAKTDALDAAVLAHFGIERRSSGMTQRGMPSGDYETGKDADGLRKQGKKLDPRPELLDTAGN